VVGRRPRRSLEAELGGTDPRAPATARRGYHQGPSGRLAQLVERLPYKQEVTGSSPVPPISNRPANPCFLARSRGSPAPRSGVMEADGSQGLARRSLSAPRNALTLVAWIVASTAPVENRPPRVLIDYPAIPLDP
jgi:hypothetical protein